MAALLLLVTCGLACGASAPAPTAGRAKGPAVAREPEPARATEARFDGGLDGALDPGLDSGLDAGRDAGPIADVKPPAHHAPWPIDSPCIDVPADVARRLPGAAAQEVIRWDLDLDGENDWVVVVESQPEKWRARGWVYLARGACGHFAAEWSGGLPQPGGEGEILVVEEPCKDPVLTGEYRCCPKTSHWRYFWDGKRRYQRRDMLTSSRTCGPVPF